VAGSSEADLGLEAHFLALDSGRTALALALALRAALTILASPSNSYKIINTIYDDKSIIIIYM